MNAVTNPIVVINSDGTTMPVLDMVELGTMQPEQALVIIENNKTPLGERGQGVLLFVLLLGLLAILISIALMAIGASVDGSEASILINALQ